MPIGIFMQVRMKMVLVIQSSVYNIYLMKIWHRSACSSLFLVIFILTNTTGLSPVLMHSVTSRSMLVHVLQTDKMLMVHTSGNITYFMDRKTVNGTYQQYCTCYMDRKTVKTYQQYSTCFMDRKTVNTYSVLVVQYMFNGQENC